MTPLSYDYVLVAKTVDDHEREVFKKQSEYISGLKKKNFKVTVGLSTANYTLVCFLLCGKGDTASRFSLISPRQKIIDEDLVFYGLQAPKEMFEKYRYLLKVSDACNWSTDQNYVSLSTR